MALCLADGLILVNNDVLLCSIVDAACILVDW
jgi:hypothetical protein